MGRVAVNDRSGSHVGDDFGLTAEPQSIARTATPASPVRVCFTGRNRAGSWTIRGEQISGQRSNWYANQELRESECDAFDIFCFVKRPVAKLHERLLALGKIVVFDVVDGWAQPDDNLRVSNKLEAVELFRQRWREMPAFHAHIFANRAMYTDLKSLTAHATFIYHHYRPGLPRNPLRKTVETVGYEGNIGYLGAWRDVIEDICRRKGLRFVTNVDDHTQVDIGFAARGGEHSGYLPNSYKSNVKLANFLATGTPCLMQATELSYHETDPGGVFFFNDERQLEKQLEALMSFETRQAISEKFLAAAQTFSIERIAATYEHFFVELRRRLQWEQVAPLETAAI